MSVINLTAMRDILGPGVWASTHADEALSIDNLPIGTFPHLYGLWVAGRIKTVGDISKIPRSFTRGDGRRYEEWTISCGWEYPQWGHYTPTAADLAAVRADGKVETFKMERNDLRRELDDEISRYFEYRYNGDR